jgi:cytochrome b561
MSGTSKGYTSLQILLHWVIVALVLYQLVFGEDMSRYVRALEDGADASSHALGGNIHLVIGIVILVLAAIRLIMRLTIGVPASVPGPALQVKAGEALHWLFYVLLFAMPITGLFAYYDLVGSLDMGEVHEFGKPLFIVFIILHAAAALYHHFMLKDSTLMRILKPGTV